MADALRRALGLRDAVLLGLGSMVGAGIFVVFSPAAAVAGPGLLIGLVVAAAIAFANATSTAQLAAAHPGSGGAYLFGREYLGQWWGYLAGCSFVIGKTASCAAMALTFASYAAPAGWQRPLAVLAVAVLVGINYLGITRTAGATGAILGIALLGIVAAVAAAASTGLPALDGFGPADLVSAGWYGILQAAGLIFFAFAGYARIATLGEEVRSPAVTIPRAIVLALGLAALLYAAVAVTVLGVLGADQVAATPTPLATAAAASGWPWVEPVVRVAAAAASLGALLALLAGISRTVLAMARNADLPGWLAAVHPRYAVPHRAELAIGIIVIALLAVADLSPAIAVSSFGVLLYYLVANLSAWRQDAADRLWPRWLPVLGTLGCGVLVVTLPPPGILAGVVVLALALGLRLLAGRFRDARR
ncbi:MAG: APC family permease [Propionicimonas sp.]